MSEFDRASGIGGSDAAVLLGLSPWRDLSDLWMEKTKHPAFKPQNETPAMRWGTLLEPVIRGEYERLEGRTVRIDPVPGLESTPGFKGAPSYWAENGIQYAHLDGWLEQGDDPGFAIWEAKTSSKPDDWEDGVPVQYEVQVQQYMDVTGAKWCDVTVLLPRSDMRTYRVEADANKQAIIRKAAQWFWRECVVPGIPPYDLEQPDLLYPVSEPADPVDLSAHDEDVQEYLRLQASIKAAKVAMSAIRERLELDMGTAPAATGPGWRISWKSSRPKRETNWEQVATSYQNALHTIDRFRDHLPPEVQAVVDRDAIAAVRSLYTADGRATRPFKVTATKEA